MNHALRRLLASVAEFFRRLVPPAQSGTGRDWRRLALPAYVIGFLALLFAGGWYVVNRQLDIPMRIVLMLAVLGFASGILLDPESVRRAFTGRQARYGSNAVIASLALLGILVVLNYLVYSNPVRTDLTEDQEFTLAPETLLTLSRLPGPVTLRGFYSPDVQSSREDLRPLLDEYSLHSGGALTYEFVDPLENPVAASEFGVSRDGSLVVIYGDNSEVIPYPSEEEITSALIHVANPEARKVYFLTGHGERDTQETGDPGYSQLQQALVSKDYEVGTLNLMTDAQVPEDALAVIIAGPLAPMSSEELESLRTYVESGGSLVLLQQPRGETEFGTQTDPLEAYLSETWGITLDDDLVVEPNSSNFLVAVSFRYGQHPITDRMQNIASIFPAARSLSLAAAGEATRTQTGLVYTSDNAWGETDLGFLRAQASPDFTAGADLLGPLTLAAAGEDPASNARVVVIGDADFASNGFFQQLGNGDLLVNSIDWAAGQESLISLTPRAATQRYVVPPSVQVTGLILLTTVVLMPGAVIVAGIYVWAQRRRRV